MLPFLCPTCIPLLFNGNFAFNFIHTPLNIAVGAFVGLAVVGLAVGAFVGDGELKITQKLFRIDYKKKKYLLNSNVYV